MSINNPHAFEHQLNANLMLRRKLDAPLRFDVNTRGRSLKPRQVLLFLVSLLFLFCTACRSLPPLPPADFKEPGWTVRQGQAVWRLSHGKSEIAGEVLVATKTKDPRAFLQFSKSPFPMVVAQIAGNRWTVEFPAQQRRYNGRGEPSKRLIWLYLPRVLEGKPPPPKWLWRQDNNGWRLENTVTKESIEGFFNQ